MNAWRNWEYLPRSVKDDALEDKVLNVFQKIVIEIGQHDIQACHKGEKNNQAIVKFSNRKDCFQILRVKKNNSRTSTLLYLTSQMA